MPFSTSASSEQAEILTQAVELYCRDCGIAEVQEREYVAELARSLYDLGTTNPDELLSRLREVMGPEPARSDGNSSNSSRLVARKGGPSLPGQ